MTSTKNGIRRETIRIDQIRLDGDTQPRVKLSDDTIEEYAEAYRAGAAMPDIRVVWDGKDFWPWDGFHRIKGAEKAKLKELEAEIRDGTLEEARWLALSANTTHGLRRSNEDKRRAVELALRQKPDLSDNAIAQHVGVDNKTVAAIRSLLEASSEIPKIEERIDIKGTKRPSKKTSGSKTKSAGDLTESVRSPAGNNDKHEDNGQQTESENTPPPPQLDPFGIAIPDDKRDVFDPAAEEMRKDALSLVRKLSDLVNDYAHTRAGEFFREDLKHESHDGETFRYRSNELHHLKFNLEKLAPHCCVCPYCHAEGKGRYNRKHKGQESCGCCHGRGWVPARVFDKANGLPSECREAVEALREEEGEE